MNYTLEKNSPTRIIVNVRTPWTELEPILPKAAEKISAEINIEGFRKGKAPYNVVKQTIGEFKILEEAARMYIQKHYESVLKNIENKEYKDKSFEPVGGPQVAIAKLAAGEDLEYKITLSLLPAIALPDYKAIAKRILADKKNPEVAEKDVDAAILWLRESRAKLIAVARGAKTGDRVEIDFSATSGGVALEEIRSANHPFILGQGKFLPGFEDNLAGIKAGEEKKFNITAPADWRDKTIAGKTLEFKVKLNEVQEREIPAWDEAFVKSFGKFSSVVEAEENIRTGLRAEKEAEERERLRIAMIEAVAKETGAEIPEPLLERELEKMVAELQISIERMGLKFSDYLTHIKKTADGLRREWRKDAERRVKIALVLREIARRENIQPSEEEIKKTMGRAIAHQGFDEKDLRTIDRAAFLDYNRGIARNEKVFRWLENISS